MKLFRPWWLPQLNSVSFPVCYPGKSAVFILFNSLINLDAFTAKLVQQPIEIRDTIIDHE